MISVCIATYNGQDFIEDQIRSILPQLHDQDEIIISDNNSSDRTIDAITGIADCRIKVIINYTPGIVSNFENCLKHASGEVIFLCDQDDVWLTTKVASTQKLLETNDLVLSNGIITNDKLKPTGRTLFDTNPPNLSVIRNIGKNSFTGCCMAFNRKILNLATPFPKDIAMHDWWIGLVALLNAKVHLDHTPQILYRRHLSNYSSTSQASTRPIKAMTKDRLLMLYNLVKLFLGSKIRSFE